ncbi:hypothetical protein D3OALGA1CA_1196 [Olavius algarvensis associated proteobacterium Delta 3]|nr:hypothetical protein D3OALGA1CA_1196 [Olavius algarvensis associated proteobacterium Delta 3]
MNRLNVFFGLVLILILGPIIAALVIINPFGPFPSKQIHQERRFSTTGAQGTGDGSSR